MNRETVRKTLIAFVITLLSATGSVLLGIFIDIMMILRYDYTPMSFTFTLPFIGALIGILLALRIIRQLNEAQ